MDAQNTQKFINVLRGIIHSYNNSIHRMINMTPADAERKEADPLTELRQEGLQACEIQAMV